MSQPEISAIVLAQDESANIERCLASLSWVDELIVVDGGSRDNTVKLARKFTKKVHFNAWPGYARQRKYALGKATKEWILSVDADEEIPSALAHEICEILCKVGGQVAGYRVPRMSRYRGVWVKHGEWYPDQQMRLFRRAGARVTDKHVHESYIAPGLLETLENPVYHYSFQGLKHHYSRMKKYADLKALDLKEAGSEWSLLETIVAPLRRARNNFFTQRGYRDGYVSIIISLMLMYYVFRTQTQLYRLLHKL